MTHPLLAILLLLPLSVSAGELDGKALICIRSDKAADVYYDWDQQNPQGYEFKEGQVTKYHVVTEGTRARINKYRPNFDLYQARLATVTWWGDYTLDRKTLALKFKYVSRSYTSERDYECELADSPEAMLETIKAAQLETQRKIDEATKDNKI